MTRIKINARRIFSLLIPFFFFTSVHAEQTAAPAKPVTVEAKNETFAPQHPDQYLSWKATSEQSERVDALAEDPRLVILWAGYPFSRDYNKPRGHAFAVTDVCGEVIVFAWGRGLDKMPGGLAVSEIERKTEFCTTKKEMRKNSYFCV